MKYLSLFLSILAHAVSFGQSCLPGGLTVTTQAELNSFAASYPNCTVIEGNVLIQGATINSLAPLANLHRINGDLTISNNPQLTNLIGLGKLTEIGGAVRIQNNAGLQSLQGLDSLRRVSGDFMYISNNASLAGLAALSRLDTVQGIFQVWSCNELTDLDGLQNLRFVGGDLAVFNNPALSTINGLNGISWIGSALRIYDNMQLSDISALNHPVNIQGALVITGNPLLSNCAVSAVCAYLNDPPSFSAFSGNGASCNAESAILAACLTSTAGLQARSSPAVFPNPSFGVVHFREELPNINRIQARNISGQIIHIEQQFKTPLDLSHLKAGVYILEVFFEDGNRESLKLVMNNR